MRGLFGKEERREIIFNVCHVNRVIFDIALASGRLDFCPSVDVRENKVFPLCDARVKDELLEHGKEYCCVPPRSFGQEGKEEHILKEPWGIATNSSGEFIVIELRHVKVFDNSGKFVKVEKPKMRFCKKGDRFKKTLHFAFSSTYLSFV